MRGRRPNPDCATNKYVLLPRRGSNSHCIGCGVFAMLLCCIVCVLVVAAVIVLMYTRPCLNDSHCQTRNPCSTDVCDGNWCTYTKVDNCCATDSDCGESGCYTSYCDIYQHTCQAYPKGNGTTCDDGDSCTVDNQCDRGACTGKTLTCSIDNECRTGSCDNRIGCKYVNSPNGLGCDDSNPCTSGDECWNGMCAVGVAKDCTSLNSVCTVGACDITTGGCVALAINEGGACDDNQGCTLNDRCSNGVCTGTPNPCFDNNPCTIDACVEGVGCMIQHQDYDETCIPGCLEHADCPFDYNCLDGTCLKTETLSNQQIRMIGYEIEPCDSATSSRLSLHLVLDTEKFTVGNEQRYRVVQSAADIQMHPQYNDLGFGSTIVNFAHNDFGGGIARSTFTMKTTCQRFDETNCAYLFTNREFRFAAAMHDCVSISGPIATGCIDPMHSIWASISTSISTCSQFVGHVTMDQPRGDAVMFYRDTYYRGNAGWNVYDGYYQLTDDNERGVVGIETSMYNSTLLRAVITDMRVCKNKPIHYLSHCVDGSNNTFCANTGCFNWDPLDSPLSWQVDIIKDQEVTAIALSSTFAAVGCYPNPEYNANTLTKCQWNKCTKLGMDDSFEFYFQSFLSTMPHLETDPAMKKFGETFIFDIKYEFHACGLLDPPIENSNTGIENSTSNVTSNVTSNATQHRRLLSTPGETMYAMSVVRMRKA